MASLRPVKRLVANRKRGEGNWLNKRGMKMFGLLTPKTDWNTVPRYRTVEEAFSKSKPPFLVQGLLHRCSNFAGSNYSGLVMVIENDSIPVLFYPTGGISAFEALTQVGDEVSFVITKERYRDPIIFSKDNCLIVENFNNLTTLGLRDPKTIAFKAGV